MNTAHGLTLRLPDGSRWRWVGYRLLPSAVTRRTQERLEQWQSACICGRTTIRLARLEDADRERFLERGDGEVTLRVVLELYPALASGSECRACRRCRVEVVAA